MNEKQTSASVLGPQPEVIGLVPAAGRAQRLQPFPCSKELFPLGFVKNTRSGELTPKVAAQYLLEKFVAAGIAKTYMVIRQGKWDIPSYFQNGEELGMSLAYIVISSSLGPPHTIDYAYPFIAQYRVAFGFPDILFDPIDAYRTLLDKQEETDADVVLGLHRIEDPSVWDMIDAEEDGRVRGILMKPPATDLTFGWHFAVWTPVFSAFLHRFLRDENTRRNLPSLASTANDPSGDLAVGIALQAALAEGLRMQSVTFSQGGPLDIGTPSNLLRALRTTRREEAAP